MAAHWPNPARADNAAEAEIAAIVNDLPEVVFSKSLQASPTGIPSAPTASRARRGTADGGPTGSAGTVRIRVFELSQAGIRRSGRVSWPCTAMLADYTVGLAGEFDGADMTGEGRQQSTAFEAGDAGPRAGVHAAEAEAQVLADYVAG